MELVKSCSAMGVLLVTYAQCLITDGSADIGNRLENFSPAA